LYYELHGLPEGFPVVFINGLLSDTTSWALQVPVFAQHFRVLIYDCRGQGQSDKPPGPYSADLHAQDLTGLLDALGIEQAHIVGISNGGTVALCFASQQQQRIARLVLVDTLAHADALIRAKLQGWLTAVNEGGPDLRFDVATPWVWGRRFLANNPDVLAAVRARAAQANVDAMRTLIEGAMQHDVRERLPQITLPTLVLVGEDDLLTPPSMARELAAGLPNAELMLVPQAGHFLTVERPLVFNAAVLAFLQQG
jgi:3-oxoadipate enol-lactonase